MVNQGTHSLHGHALEKNHLDTRKSTAKPRLLCVFTRDGAVDTLSPLDSAHVVDAVRTRGLSFPPAMLRGCSKPGNRHPDPGTRGGEGGVAGGL